MRALRLALFEMKPSKKLKMNHMNAIKLLIVFVQI